MLTGIFFQKSRYTAAEVGNRCLGPRCRNGLQGLRAWKAHCNLLDWVICIWQVLTECHVLMFLRSYTSSTGCKAIFSFFHFLESDCWISYCISFSGYCKNNVSFFFFYNFIASSCQYSWNLLDSRWNIHGTWPVNFLLLCLVVSCLCMNSWTPAHGRQESNLLQR